MERNVPDGPLDTAEGIINGFLASVALIFLVAIGFLLGRWGGAW